MAEEIRRLTEDEAIALSKTGWWKDRTAEEIMRFQMAEERLAMPFGEFHEAVEEALGRPVWTHEFVDPDRLMAELDGDEPTPENPNQHAVDLLAALLVSMGKDPDEQMIVLGVEEENDG